MKWKSTIALAGLVGALAGGTYYRRELSSLLKGTVAGTESSLPALSAASPHDLHDAIQQIYQQNRLATPQDFQKQFRTLKDDLVLFLHNNSSDIVAGKYDPEMKQLDKYLHDFFERLEQHGNEEMQKLYGQVGEKLNQSLLNLRREVCQGELDNFARDLDAVLDKYLTPETRRQQQYSRTLSSLDSLLPDELRKLAGETQRRLPDEAYQDLLKQKDLDFWLGKLKSTYGVDFTPEKKLNQP